MAYSERQRVIYVAGSNFCGSTLLSMILRCHPEVESLGQVFEAPAYFETNDRCMCGHSAQSCVFWNRVMAAVGLWNERGEPLKPASQEVAHRGWLHRRFGWVRRVRPPDLEAYRTMNVRLFEAASQTSGRRILVDSSKIAHRLKWLARSGADQDLDLRVIHIVRNGLGVLSAHRRRKHLALRGIWSWRRRNAEALRVAKKYFPHRWLRLRYEDLCRSPVATIRSVCEFVGVAYDPAMMDFRGRTQHQVGGNPARFGSEREIQLDERWREDLNSWDRWLFRVLAGRLQRRLGYEV